MACSRREVWFEGARKIPLQTIGDSRKNSTLGCVEQSSIKTSNITDVKVPYYN